MKCKRPFYLEERALFVPCGKCTYCRIVKRREWTLRILHELESHSKSCFVTLTYSDENLLWQPVRPVHFPVLPSLSIPDFQKFFKRLRKLSRLRLRYYAAGEYGESATLRPHYHAIIFGIDPFDGPVRERDDGYLCLPGHPLADAWRRGDVHVGFAEEDSIQYTSSYIDKKRYGESMLFNHYEFRQPEFQLQSLGIGRDFIDSRFAVTARRGSLLRYAKEIGVPRYYDKRIRSDPRCLLRALDYYIYTSRREASVIESQVELCEEVSPDVGAIPYRDMDDADRRLYSAGLIKRNQVIDMNLVAKGKIKGLRRKI